jgi:hypothetical protein
MGYIGHSVPIIVHETFFQYDLNIRQYHGITTWYLTWYYLHCQCHTTVLSVSI